jgi:hypothetical protein
MRKTEAVDDFRKWNPALDPTAVDIKKVPISCRLKANQLIFVERAA